MKPAPTLNLNLQFATDALEAKWSHILSKTKIKKWVGAALQEDADLTIRFVGAAESKRLNTAYRNKSYATNVLTFPYDLQPGIETLTADIVICLPIVQKEAKEQGKNVTSHVIHLLVHGTLHAQGFDHEDEVEAEAMESLEIAILKKLKQSNPYA